jgi:hypothetical protein
MRRRFEDSSQSHGGTKQGSRAYENILSWIPNYKQGSSGYEIILAWCQNVNKIITREPMNGRIYHVNYNTSKQQIRFYVAT